VATLGLTPWLFAFFRYIYYCISKILAPEGTVKYLKEVKNEDKNKEQ